MKHLDQVATRIFNAIMAELGESDYCKIANSSVFMAVNVDRIAVDAFTLAHNSVQNGDVMADPDMTFWRGPDGHIYPCTFQNDFLGLFQETVTFKNGKPATYKPTLQANITKFANQWMRNIANQQGVAI